MAGASSPEQLRVVRAVQQISEHMKDVARAIESVRLPMPAVLALEPLPDPTEHEISIIAAGVTQALEQQQEPSRLKPGVKPTDVPKATRMKVAELQIAGESIEEIRRQTKLSKTVATRLVREVDAVLAALRAGRY
jgi:hypothetical protein